MQLNTEFHQKSRCRFAFNKRQVDLVNMTSEGSQIATSIDEKPCIDGGGEPCVSAAVSFQYQIAW